MHKRNEKINHYHDATGSRITLMRLTDDGKTWSDDSRVIIDASDGTHDLNMPLITQLPSGQLIVTNHRWFMNMTTEQITALEGKRLFLYLRSENYRFGTVGFDSLYIVQVGTDVQEEEGFGGSSKHRVRCKSLQTFAC